LAIETLKETSDSTTLPSRQPVIKRLQAPVRAAEHAFGLGREAIVETEQQRQRRAALLESPAHWRWSHTVSAGC